MANDKDLFLVSSFTVCSVSVFEEDPDLSNEGALFSAMYFSLSLLNIFSEYDYDAFCFSICKSPISPLILSFVGLTNEILEDMIFCFDLFYLF